MMQKIPKPESTAEFQEPAVKRVKEGKTVGAVGSGRADVTPLRQQYAARAGGESTHEQAIRRSGLRQYRYLGEAKTHLQHLVTAVAMNLIRIGEWLAGTPMAATRCSRVAALQQRADGFAAMKCRSSEKHLLYTVRNEIHTSWSSVAELKHEPSRGEPGAH
jgi:hypothetical protein